MFFAGSSSTKSTVSEPSWTLAESLSSSAFELTSAVAGRKILNVVPIPISE